MNLKSILAVVVAVLAGTVGGAVAYTVATPSSASEPASTSTTLQPAAETQDVAAGLAEKIVKLRPCKKPAHLVGKKCVTDVTRTVVVPGQARSSAPAPASPATVGSDDDQGEDADDQYDDHGGTPGTGSEDEGDDDQYGDDSSQDDDDSDDEAEDQSDDEDEPGDDESESESPEVED